MKIESCGILMGTLMVEWLYRTCILTVFEETDMQESKVCKVTAHFIVLFWVCLLFVQKSINVFWLIL